MLRIRTYSTVPNEAFLLTYIYIHTEKFIERYSREIESEALDDSKPY